MIDAAARMLVDGELVPGRAGSFSVLDPTTTEVVADAPAADAEDLGAAARAARRAADRGDWSASPARRADALRRLLGRLEASRETLRELLVREGGVPVRLTRSIHLDGALEDLRWICDLVERYAWEEPLPDRAFHGFVSGRRVRRVPVGVALLLTPANFPVALVLKRLFTALAAGNTVVVKPSPETPLAALAVGRLAAECGFPPGVVNVVTTRDTAAVEDLCRHPAVDLVGLTGSSATGRRVSALAAERVARTVLHLGGKSAHVLLPDAPFPDVLLAGARACFHGGQACSLYTRLLVPRSEYEPALEVLADVVASVPHGDPRDPDVIMGPLVSAVTRDRFLSAVRAARQDGARVVTGGGEPSSGPPGYFVEPTVLADLPPASAILREEVPGPALLVLPYEDEDDAVAQANSSVYGLAAAVTSASDARALAVARRLRAGAVSVNDGLPYGPDSPFAPFGHSGHAHDGGAAALEDYVVTQVLGTPGATSAGAPGPGGRPPTP